MRTIIRLFSIAILMIALTGCKTQKPAVKTIKSEALYQQALKALDEHLFIIEASEFYFTTGESPQSSPGSYISMRGDKVNVRFTPNLFPGTPLGDLNVTDNMAEMTKENSKKNGNTQFIIKIKGYKSWLDCNLFITLYKNSNQCFVQVKGTKIEAVIVSFIGLVHPIDNNR